MKTNFELLLHVINQTVLLPVNDTEQDSKVELRTPDGQSIIRFSIKLTEGTPDYYIPVDISAYLDQTISIHVESNTILPTVQKHLEQVDKHKHEHHDIHRPLYHYSSPFGWINDPNGLYYHLGKYHLYYQHNPYGARWGNMSWGHAHSEDLIHWHTQPAAILPNSFGDIFSGSIIVDQKNDAGFGKDTILAFYTSAGDRQTQCLAYSNDNGQTFTNYKHNPILSDPNYTDFRDPKVFWHEDSAKWIMSLATSQTISFYSSTNLKEWTKISEFGDDIGNHEGVWECPDLFQLSHGKHQKWVLFVSVNPGGPNEGSATQYFIGEFNGQSFVADILPYPLWIDYGRDNYAGVCWHNNPKSKPLYIGWMSNWDYANQIPTKLFKNAMTLPRTLEIGNNGKHLIVKNSPVKEVKKLRKVKKEFSNRLLDRSITLKSMLEDNTGAFELDLEFSLIDPQTSTFTLTLFNHLDERLIYTFDLKNEKIFTDRSKSGLTAFSTKFATPIIQAPFPRENQYKIKLFIDTASAELFINKGKIALTNVILPTEPYNHITLEVKNGTIDISKFRIFSLAL